MKHRHALRSLILFLFAMNTAAAGPGDTLVVQTFTWDWPVNPGWNAPREGWFDFPDDGGRYEKILMYYSLKCDPSQNPACGEWDYLTYTRLYEHTGVFDSNQVTHPNFIVNGRTPDTLAYMINPSYRFLPRIEQRIVYDDTTEFATGSLGSGSEELTTVLGAAAPDSRSYLLWTGEELDAAGIAKDDITALRLHAGPGDGRIHRLTLRLRRYTLAGWQDDVPLGNPGWVTVYDGAMELTPNSWNTIRFVRPFSYWSGAILAEFTIDRMDGAGISLVASDLGEDRTFTARESDGLLFFDQYSHVNCGSFPELNDAQAFTLEAWMRADRLRNWSNLIIKGSANENRIGIQFNAPEGGRSDVYCLVGNGENSYGRTQNRPVKEGSWVHLSMVYDGTRNTQEDRLRLFINGERQLLGFNGTIPAFTAINDADFTISSFKADALTGTIDEVRIWRTALTEEQIRQRAFRQLITADPLFDQLLAYYDFNDGTGVTASDRAGDRDGKLLFPQWQSYRGDRVKGFTPSPLRPNVIFEQGEFTSHIEETLAVDTLEQPGLMVILYEDTARANIPTDTLFVWPPYSTYTFAQDGSVVDSQRVIPDGHLFRNDHFYYDTPFELVRHYELGRYITPYGIGLDLGEGWTWVYDVTDFAPLLADSVHLTAGNFQELLDMKFVFIEGTPPRDVIKVENLWQGTFALNVFEEKVPPRTVSLDPRASMFKLRTSATGHDFSNATNCAEFCPKIHSVEVDGTQRWNWQIIQECADNPLYPQGGTWIYDRAGWCPGMEATVKEFELTEFIQGDQVELDYDSQYDEFGRYVFESQLVSYDTPNHQVDAAIDVIIAPNNDALRNRFNPTCGRPRIVIQNRGAQELTSLRIVYGPRGGNSNTYAWTGSLGFLEKETVILPSFDWGEWGTENIFDFRIETPNGGSDEYPSNDTQFSFFETVPMFDAPLVVRFATNSAPYENRWEVRDRDGSVVYNRSSFGGNRTYYDTLDLVPGCYEIELFDSGDDGISWWANNDGDGSFRIAPVGSGSWYNVNPDFGKSIRYPFRYSNLVAVEGLTPVGNGVDLYPNPVSDLLTIDYRADNGGMLQYTVYNMLGEMVLEGEPRQVSAGMYREQLPVHALQPGSYVVVIADGSEIFRRMRFAVVR
ncbi:MAG: T9SS type A sorting domain-containing protein [Bacteroidetes bacterium]|nr:T9SS type A sorting domain-containing protein [Bacteroidota bacterium]